MGDEASSRELFGTLRKQVKANKLERVIAAADAILEAAPADADAVRCKCVALARKGRFGAARALARSDDLAAVRAYCEYRDGELSLAAASAARDGGGPLARHVVAQIAYKRGEFEAAAAAYDTLVDASSSNGELHANRLAAFASANKGAEALATFEAMGAAALRSPAQHYELLFNGACALLDAGRVHEAARFLDAALRGAPEEEAAPIAAQRAYCDAVRGEYASCAERCKGVLKSKPSDAAVVASCVNTLLCARGDAELFDSHKRLKPLAEQLAHAAAAGPPCVQNSGGGPLTTKKGDELRAKLSQSKQTVTRLNWATLLLRMGKTAECREALDALEASSPDNDEAPDEWRSQVQLLRVLARETSAKRPQGGGGDEALKKICALKDALKARLAETPRTSLRLALAQCEASLGDCAQAAQTLQTDPRLAQRRGVAATIAQLLQHAGDRRGAARALAADLEEGECDAVFFGAKALALAAHRLRLCDSVGAARQLRAVDVRADECGRVAAAALVNATSWFDVDAAERLGADYFEDDSIEEDDIIEEDDMEEPLDAELLLATPCPRSTHARAGLHKAANKDLSEASRVTVDTLRSKRTPAQRANARAKRRLAYIAKLTLEGKYDPSLAPDPERWIAKKQRSYNKRGRKNRGKFSGAQGGDANVKDVAKLDAATRAKDKKIADDKDKQDADALALTTGGTGGGGGKKNRQPRKKR